MTPDLRLIRATLKSEPMLYVTARTPMRAEELSTAMAKAFNALEAFLGSADIGPTGSPMALYSDWDGRMVTLRVAVPVRLADAARAILPVFSGHTPAGPALMARHIGPYARLGETYAAIEKLMHSAGIGMGSLTWEVYHGEPGHTPEAELVTEIFMQIRPDEAERLPLA